MKQSNYNRKNPMPKQLDNYMLICFNQHSGGCLDRHNYIQCVLFALMIFMIFTSTYCCFKNIPVFLAMWKIFSYIIIWPYIMKSHVFLNDLMKMFWCCSIPDKLSWILLLLLACFTEQSIRKVLIVMPSDFRT